MDKLKSQGKSFDISKREVWEAFQQVKRNKGAPGVDGQSIKAFEADLKNNLYKIWNRMSSGTYFPPPVRAVEIPKQHGAGTRMLGIPCVGDRVAQTVVARHLEARVEPVFHEDSYGYRPEKSALDAVQRCRERCWKRNWVIDLDVAKFFDSVRWDLIVKAVEAQYRRPLGTAVCKAVASSSATATRRDLTTARSWNPARVSGFARAGEPVPALCVRRVAGPGVPDRPVRTLR